MRLLNTHTYRVEEFLTEIPKYAILSHTWERDEVTFQDIQNLDVAKTRAGWSKIKNACAYVRKHKYDWIWIDTCCIDKSSSADLSEAFNSMYNYYSEAHVCVAYLSDLENGWNKATAQEMPSRLRRCKWFTRGWTLQELIAPHHLVFLDEDWQYAGTRFSLRHLVSEITCIPVDVFEGGQLRNYNIGQKMSWAASRETTRPEDMAYCLMGLFDVNMPPIYGEGGERAFMRLQREIIKWSDDHSIEGYERDRGLFASSPSEFGVFGEVGKSRSDNSRGEAEQHSWRRNSNDDDTDTKDTHDTSDNPRSPSEESPIGLSRNYGNINKYTEQDNRNIGRNIENHGIYYEFEEHRIVYVNSGDWKAVVATGGMAFWAGHTTTQLGGSHTQQNQLQLPTNKAITTIYAQHSFDHLPSMALSIVLSVMLIDLLSFVRHSILTRLAG